MFTGIVKDVGKVVRVQAKPTGDKSFTIQTDLNLNLLGIGGSICCHGVCLTVTDKHKDAFTVDTSNETLAVTNLGTLTEGSRLNLEPSLHLGDEMGGHIVSGHVDGVAEIVDLQQDGDSIRLKIKVPDEFKQYIAFKGSVALNGVSLTVNKVEGNVFGINLVPYTLEWTTFDALVVGDRLNLEVDTMARYVARILENIHDNNEAA